MAEMLSHASCALRALASPSSSELYAFSYHHTKWDTVDLPEVRDGVPHLIAPKAEPGHSLLNLFKACPQVFMRVHAAVCDLLHLDLAHIVTERAASVPCLHGLPHGRAEELLVHLDAAHDLQVRIDAAKEFRLTVKLALCDVGKRFKAFGSSKYV